MRSTARIALCVTLASVAASFALTAPRVAHAQNGAPTEQARAHFARGVELFKEGDFRAALIEFQRAYDAAPNYKVLYNLGQTSLELQDYAGALKAFRGYLDQGGKDVPAPRRSQVETDLHKLESRIARVEVTVNAEGADVLIDDVPVAKTPLREPLIVSEGRRKITVTKTGLAPVSRVVDIAGGDRPTINLELGESSPAHPEASPPPPPNPLQNAPTLEPGPAAPARGGLSTGFWVGFTITGALGVATGVLGTLALFAKSDFDSKVAQLDVTTQQVDDARNKTHAFALATDITGGVTIAAAITTVVLAFTTSGRKESNDTHAHAHAILGPGSLGIAGSF